MGKSVDLSACLTRLEDVAAALGSDWEVAPLSTLSARTLSGDGVSYLVHTGAPGSMAERWFIIPWLGELARYSFLYQPFPRITVSARRSAESIARDLLRRLHPQTKQIFQRARAQKQSADELYAAREKTAAILLQAGGVFFRQRGASPDCPVLYSRPTVPALINIVVSDEDSVNFTMVDAEPELVKVLVEALVTELKKGNSSTIK